MKNERNINSTKLIYETDAYISEFEATVLKCYQTEDKGYAVVLDRTAFFPEGGGQDADSGTIGDAKVSFVERKDGEVIHYVDRPLEEDSILTGKVNWELRFERMQSHSGEHLLCGVIHNEYGYDNIGFHMSSDGIVTVDLDGYLDSEQLGEIEYRVNKAIYENVPITVSFPTTDEAELIEYRSKLELTDGIRLVTIEGYDVCACCAPHVNRTGEIGLLKIISGCRHRGGSRIEMLAGKNAFLDYVKLSKVDKTLMDVLSVSHGEGGEAAVKLSEKCKALSVENTGLKNTITKLLTEQTVSKLKERAGNDSSPELIFTDSMDEIMLRNLINSCVEVFPGIVAGFLNNQNGGYRFLIRCGDEEGISLPEIAAKMRTELNAKGGGSRQMIQGNVDATEDKLREFFV